MLAQVTQLMADKRPAIICLDRHQRNPAIGKVQHLQGAGILDQALDIVRDQLLRTDQHVHRQGLLRKQA